nr:MAG TPA: hypothetical protein [Caudoviricetes sp.]
MIPRGFSKHRFSNKYSKKVPHLHKTKCKCGTFGAEGGI